MSQKKRIAQIQRKIKGGASNAEIIESLKCSKSFYYDFIKTHNIANPNGNISAGFIQAVAKVSPYYAKPVAVGMNAKYKTINTIKDIPQRLKYNSKVGLNRFNQHLGQRKLFLTESKFLSHVIPKETTKKNIKKGTNTSLHQYVIYAGSSPGNKNFLFRLLFPDVKFILIDPNKADILIPMEPDRTNIVAKFRKTTSHRSAKHPDVIHLYVDKQYGTKSLMWGDNKKIGDMSARDISQMLKFIETSSHNIYLIEDFMTNDLAKILSRLPGKKYFISDIRSNISGHVHPTDEDILWNSSMMYNWIHILQPEWSMIKFRPPHRIEHMKIRDNDEFKLSRKLGGLDFISDYDKDKFMFPRGDVHVQPWKGNSSTETRLWIQKKNIGKFIEYDRVDHEERLFFYNNVMRNYGCFPNPAASEPDKFCYCADCHIEYATWKKYIARLAKPTRPKNTHIIDYVRLLNHATRQVLARHHIFAKFDKRSAHDLYCMFKSPPREIKRKFGKQPGNTGK